MPSFEVLTLGVGDAFSMKYHPTAFVLGVDGYHLAVDCPDSYEAVLKEATDSSGIDLTISDIDAVLITHLHGDHVNGLEMFAYRRFFYEGKRLRLVCSPEVRSVIWEHRLQCSMGVLFDGSQFNEMHFDDYFDYVPLEWSRETNIGPFEITARATKHHIPTSALLVKAAGRAWGYSCDTAFDPGLIDFLNQADLIFHETNLGHAHTSYEELAALPPNVREKMRLVHYSDDFDTTSPEVAALSQGALLGV